MQSANPASSPYTPGIHPALSSFADEVCGTLARLFAYAMALSLLAIGGMAMWEQLPGGDAAEPAPRDPWSLADRSTPAFAVGQVNSHDKTATYEIFRHPQGGRRDVIRWISADRTPVAELEIYRPGGELSPEGSAIPAQFASGGTRELEAAGLIDSKFGTVTLLRPIGGTDRQRACLAFAKRISDPNLRIAGWTCGDDSLPARRSSISCMLNRLTLLSTLNDPKLAELFARAELRRTDCATPAAPALSADWVTGAGNPQLRGAF